MRYLIYKLLGIVLGVAMLVAGYIYWDDIKAGVKNAFEWVQGVKEERNSGACGENDELWLTCYEIVA